jgi:hypothetical protein
MNREFEENTEKPEERQEAFSDNPPEETAPAPPPAESGKDEIKAERMDGTPLEPGQDSFEATSRIYLPRTKKMELKNLSKYLDLDGLDNIKVKKVDERVGRASAPVRVEHFKRYTYIPPEPDEKTPEEAEKEKTEEELKKQKAEKKKKVTKKGSRTLVEKGIRPKIILTAFIILLILSIWYYVAH